MIEKAIQLADVSYTYPTSKFCFYCADACFNAKEITFITGANGSGKSTMSKLMCGILRPNSGSLHIFQNCANGWSLGKIGKYIGYLYQEPSVQLFSASVWDELTFVSSIKGEDERSAALRADELLCRFGLDKFKNRSPHSLSRGEKQRLALAAILMQGARFLILDEPSTGLDADNRQILYKTLRELLKSGVGLAVITHDSELLNEFFDAKRLAAAGGRLV